MAVCFPDMFVGDVPTQDDLRGLVIGEEVEMVMDKILSVMPAHFTRETTERILSIVVNRELLLSLITRSRPHGAFKEKTSYEALRCMLE